MIYLMRGPRVLYLWRRSGERLLCCFSTIYQLCLMLKPCGNLVRWDEVNNGVLWLRQSWCRVVQWSHGLDHRFFLRVATGHKGGGVGCSSEEDERMKDITVLPLQLRTMRLLFRIGHYRSQSRVETKPPGRETKPPGRVPWQPRDGYLTPFTDTAPKQVHRDDHSLGQTCSCCCWCHVSSSILCFSYSYFFFYFVISICSRSRAELPALVLMCSSSVESAPLPLCV